MKFTSTPDFYFLCYYKGYVQYRYDTKVYGEKYYTYIGIFYLRHFRNEFLGENIEHGFGRKNSKDTEVPDSITKQIYL